MSEISIQGINQNLIGNQKSTLAVQQKSEGNNLLFDNTINDTSLSPWLDIDLSQTKDTPKTLSEFKPRNAQEQKEFLEQYGVTDIGSIGFQGLTDKEAALVLKIQEGFGNDNKISLSSYPYSKNFNQQYYNLVLTKGVVYPDGNEDCKVDD